jgi:ADP-heptose:LPS heptosyltransferase
MSMPFNNRECLTVRLSALGDAILTTGVLAYWHKRAGLTFRVLTRPQLAPVFAHHPAVSRIITVRDEDLRGAAWIRFCRSLAREMGGLPLIDLHGNLRTLMLRLLWPGPTRTYPKHSLRRRLFLATRHPLPAARLRRLNVPQRYCLALGSSPVSPDMLRPRIFLSDQEKSLAIETLARLGAQRPVAIHPYATHPAKTPRPEVWKDLVQALRSRGDEVIVIGRHEQPLLPADPHDLTNTTDLRATSALLSLCRALVTGDSGPMHLATAVDTPVAALFGPTTREWGFYPSGPHDKVWQIPCTMAPCSLHGQDACALGNACMREISTASLLELIDSSARRPLPLGGGGSAAS